MVRVSDLELPIGDCVFTDRQVFASIEKTFSDASINSACHFERTTIMGVGVSVPKQHLQVVPWLQVDRFLPLDLTSAREVAEKLGPLQTRIKQEQQDNKIAAAQLVKAEPGIKQEQARFA